MTGTDQAKIVALRACDDYSFARVKKAVISLGDDCLGGWSRAIPSGSAVLLKPNLLRPATARQAVSPHPAVIRAVAELCRDAGARSIIIGDSPGFGTAGKVAEKCGIMQVARDLDLKVVDFSESVQVPAPRGFVHREFSIAREVAEADIIINLPKFKTHAMMGLTLAVKNMFGVFVGRQKARWHFQCGRDYRHFARLLVELAYTVRPAVSVLDAVVAMEGNGPGNGRPRRMGFLAASKDMHSLDHVACEIAGVDIRGVFTLQAACDMGVAQNAEKIAVIGEHPETLRAGDLKPARPMAVEGPAFLRPLSWAVRRWMTSRPRVNARVCKGCGLCVKACPARSIDQDGTGTSVVIRHDDCIRCFCCQELCPEGAIAACEAWGVRMMKSLRLE